MGRVGNHIRSNVVGYAALFVALSGTAYAVDGPLAGQNTVGERDIINDEIHSVDVRDDTLPSGGLGAIDLRPDSVRSSEVMNDSLVGADINESTLRRPIYAKVDPNGNIVPEDSEGMGNTTVRKPPGTTGIYCFDNLPIDAKSAMATSLNSAINTGVIVATSGWPNDCVEGEEAKVEQRVTDTLNPIDQYFVVWFTD